MSYFKKQLYKKPEVWSRQKLETYKRALRDLGRTERQIERELKEQIRAAQEQEERERKPDTTDQPLRVRQLLGSNHASNFDRVGIKIRNAGTLPLVAFLDHGP